MSSGPKASPGDTVSLPPSDSRAANAAADARSVKQPARAQALALARYRLTASFAHDLQLPAYAGPLLRGVLGLALRQGVCVTGAPVCTGCPLLQGCAYPAVYETPPRPTQLPQRFSDVPHPYVIEPPLPGPLLLPAGQPLVWHMVLVGTDTLARLPLLVQAWQRALSQGLGQQRTAGELLALEWLPPGGTPVHLLQSGQLQPHRPLLPWPVQPTACSELELDFHTPLRLQREGRALHPAELSPRTLVAQLLRRCGLMLEQHLGQSPAGQDARALVALAATLDDDRSGLRWQAGERYSARQRRSVPLDGVLGRWVLRGNLAPLKPWLQVGQWLHLGKAAVMGLGGYRLLEPEAGPVP